MGLNLAMGGEQVESLLGKRPGDENFGFQVVPLF
jgi:hypothetical protein